MNAKTKIGSNLQEAVCRIKEIPNAIVATTVLGSFNLMALFPVTTIGEILELQKSIYSLEFIDTADFIIGPLSITWPPNFFASLL